MKLRSPTAYYDTSLWITVYLFCVYCLNAMLWRMEPSDFKLFCVGGVWVATWLQVNMLLANAERRELLEEASENEDIEFINAIGRVDIRLHTLDLMLFRSPARRYRR